MLGTLTMESKLASLALLDQVQLSSDIIMTLSVQKFTASTPNSSNWFLCLVRVFYVKIFVYPIIVHNTLLPISNTLTQMLYTFIKQVKSETINCMIFKVFMEKTPYLSLYDNQIPQSMIHRYFHKRKLSVIKLSES